MQNTEFFSQNTEGFFMGCTGLHGCVTTSIYCMKINDWNKLSTFAWVYMLELGNQTINSYLRGQ